MPTTRPRHMITETDDVRIALDRAAQEWPEDEDRPSRLILRLIATGQHTLENQVQGVRERRRSAAGRLSGLYPPGYLEELRKDWPE